MTERPARSLRGLLTWGSGTDGRVVLLAVVATYLTAVVVGRQWLGFDLWPFLGVPSGPSLFFDARNLTAAWECQRLGYDPLYVSPCDPWGRPLMYLRPWLLLGVLGLDQTHTFAFAAVLIVAMFLSFCLLVGRASAGTGVVLALAACSPAVMFAVERANMDIALFSVVAVSVLLWRAFPRAARIVSPVAVLLGATAKIYPAFALPVFMLTRSRVAARTALLCLALFAVYLAYSLRDVQHVAAIATQGETFSYGARILPAHLYHQLGADYWPGPAALKQLIALLPLAVMAAAIVIRAQARFSPRKDETSDTTATLIALHAGAFIYLGTFAMANNFDYRLVFLLLTLPQLVEWACTPAHRLSLLASVTLIAIIVMLWLGSLSHWLNLWDEVASWAVAGLLAAVVAATMPRANSIRKTLLGDAVR